MKKKVLPLTMLLLLKTSIKSEVTFPKITSWFSGSSKKTYNKIIPVATNTSVNIHNTNGSISIHTWTEQKIVVDAVITGKEKNLETTQIIAEENTEKKTVSITTQESDSAPHATVHYEIMVPDTIDLVLYTESGDIKVKNSRGTINASTGDGKLYLLDIQNSVFGYTGNGAAEILCKQLKAEHTIQIEADRGNITLGLATATNANIAAKTLQGTVTTEQQVTLKPQQTQLGNHAWKLFKQQAFCTLGTGGTSVSLFTKHGNIKIIELY